MTMELTGQSLIGSRRGSQYGAGFQGANPRTGDSLQPIFHSATPAEVDEAIELSSSAFASYSQTGGRARGAFLRRIADGFDAHRQELAERATP